jgi:hypothetical protein
LERDWKFIILRRGKRRREFVQCARKMYFYTIWDVISGMCMTGIDTSVAVSAIILLTAGLTSSVIRRGCTHPPW